MKDHPQVPPAEAPSGSVENGTVVTLDGKERVFYDGYWIRYYAPPENTPGAKQVLLISLARRVFHHTEPGINTPGSRLDAAYSSYELEQDPGRKRVKGAMLAGALFNRAIDILNVLVELDKDGTAVSMDNEVMMECGRYLQEASKYGKMVKHYSGEEGIDEIWGEPFKAFSLSMEEYYHSRYAKIASCMRNIDSIVNRMSEVFTAEPGFADVATGIHHLGQAAKTVAETFRNDPSNFDVWAAFVTTSEAIEDFTPAIDVTLGSTTRLRIGSGTRLLRRGKDIVNYLARARVPMPKTTATYLDLCGKFASGEGEPGLLSLGQP